MIASRCADTGSVTLNTTVSSYRGANTSSLNSSRGIGFHLNPQRQRRARARGVGAGHPHRGNVIVVVLLDDGGLVCGGEVSAEQSKPVLHWPRKVRHDERDREDVRGGEDLRWERAAHRRGRAVRTSRVIFIIVGRVHKPLQEKNMEVRSYVQVRSRERPRTYPRVGFVPDISRTPVGPNGERAGGIKYAFLFLLLDAVACTARAAAVSPTAPGCRVAQERVLQSAELLCQKWVMCRKTVERVLKRADARGELGQLLSELLCRRPEGALHEKMRG